LQAAFRRAFETINLKGILVVNGATHWDYDCSPSFPQTVYNFNLIPQALYDRFEDNKCFFSFNGVLPGNTSEICEEAWAEINKLTASLNWYDLYRNVYPDSGLLRSENRVGVSYVEGEKKTYKRGMTQAEYTPWLKQHVSTSTVILGNGVSDYLNREDVRAALHIPISV